MLLHKRFGYITKNSENLGQGHDMSRTCSSCIRHGGAVRYRRTGFLLTWWLETTTEYRKRLKTRNGMKIRAFSKIM